MSILEVAASAKIEAEDFLHVEQIRLLAHWLEGRDIPKTKEVCELMSSAWKALPDHTYPQGKLYRGMRLGLTSIKALMLGKSINNEEPRHACESWSTDEVEATGFAKTRIKMGTSLVMSRKPDNIIINMADLLSVGWGVGASSGWSRRIKDMEHMIGYQKEVLVRPLRKIKPANMHMALLPVFTVYDKKSDKLRKWLVGILPKNKLDVTKDLTRRGSNRPLYRIALLVDNGRVTKVGRISYMGNKPQWL